MAKELEVLGSEEQGNTEIKTISKNIVQCNLTAKPDKDSPVRFKLVWEFDFSDCTAEEIQEIAANYLKIRQQDFWRKQQNYKDASWNGKRFNVKKDIMSRERSRTNNPVKKAENLVAKMSPAEREQLIALLGTSNKKK